MHSAGIYDIIFSIFLKEIIIIMMYVLLIAGFVLLIKGADFFVEGSSSVAKKLSIPPLIIGMTIVAMGTSLPETSVSVTASLAGANDLSISNAVGSNIINLLVVAGICALFHPLPVQRDSIKRDFPFSIIASAILLAFGFFTDNISRIAGAALLLVFVVFMISMVHNALMARKSGIASAEGEEIKLLPGWQCVIYIIGGIIAIAAGGKMVVEGASDIAKSFGMSDNLIGMTIVALGTSLPELVTSLVAAKKNETDMALGNVIGSNVFNILFVLGIAAVISPIAFTMQNCIDTLFLIGTSLLVLVFCLPKKKIVRWHGLSMVALYAGYTVYLFVR